MSPHAASRVPLWDRIEELTAFQKFMDNASAVHGRPEITRAQVIVQNYVCLFTSKRPVCCKFLTDNPVRAFRNAIAHANWTYAPDFGRLVFWARKGANQNEPLSRFKVSQNDLDFCLKLSRGVAYAAYTVLESFEDA